MRPGAAAFLPNRYDVFAFAILFGVFIAAAHGAHVMERPLAALDFTPVSLEPVNLIPYALLSTLRMFAAIIASLVFTFVVATLAAKSRKAELVIIPALDILQSVPVLGFLSFTVTAFMGLFPGNELGAEMAAIFAIFTSQAWNMTFAFYQALRTVPKDMQEVARHFRLSGWMRFWRIEAPFATPGLVWNTMMSMSGGWFFVVASEAITVGNTKVTLPGIGSYLALAIEKQDLVAVAWAIVAMGVVILIYDQLVFRPIVAWADKFRVELTAKGEKPTSWVYDVFRHSGALRFLGRLFSLWSDWWARTLLTATRRVPPVNGASGAWADGLWIACVAAGAAWGAWTIVAFVREHLTVSDVGTAFWLGSITFARVAVLIALASLIWVPVGVWIGLRPAVAERVQPLAQFLAAFPANVMFPFFVVVIAGYHLDPNIWLSPLMILGTQWYILFNVIAGASAFPNDLLEATTIMKVSRWQWWRDVMLPGIFPYYITGALTAAGGSWNASIVAEVVSWGNTRIEATGLGAYIAKATEAGDMPRIVLGISVMSLFVIAFNRLLWRRLYTFAEQRLRLE
ncbi:ABC transporter permease subunit [Hyphomicrobium sp.]|uniref:ABC transporter permease n=1 Tax=Hyphomicrobium sp. TaxID=82 RepID=UPI0025C39DB3|nr:ABC transporter permease subunit [Hyphomicrobium sp.]